MGRWRRSPQSRLSNLVWGGRADFALPTGRGLVTRATSASSVMSAATPCACRGDDWLDRLQKFVLRITISSDPPTSDLVRTGCAHRPLQAQRSIAVTSRQSSGPHGKLMPMGSTKHVGAEAATGEEAKMPGVAHTTASEKAAASYPIILRSYEPVAELDERLRRIFAVLSLPPVVE